jgi:capping protein (actin filament) muscle Z-line, beta
MVEDMENKIRNTLNEIYFGKTKNIINNLRSIQPLEDELKQTTVQDELRNAITKRNVKGNN